MGQGINTVGKISTGIQGLDKMLLGGLPLEGISIVISKLFGAYL